MTHQDYDNSGRAASSKRHRLLTFTSALLLGAGAIIGSLPAFAGDNNAENSAGEGNFDHSGIYTILAPHGDFNVPFTGTNTADRGYYYLEGQGRVPLKLRSNRSLRGN
jgi:hypothetical protein